MADLVTHACIALLPGAWTRSRALPAVVVGTVLPDALGRAVPLGLEALELRGAPVPGALIWMWAALHEPIGWALASVLLAQLFVASDRRTVLLALWLGGALHTGLDVLQDHHGEGYLLLAPLSTHRLELGWIGSEATVDLALPLLAVTALAWLPRAVDRLGGPPTLRLRVLLAVTVPVHLALPWLAGWLRSGTRMEGIAGAWLWLHLAFLVFLVSSRHWWRDRWLEVAGVVALDQVAVALGLLCI